MNTPLVTVLPHAKVSGWPGAGEPYPTMPLLEALTLHHETDAHIVPYWWEEEGEPSPRCPRLNLEALNQLTPTESIKLQCILFDLDGPNHTYSDAFKANVLGRLAKLPPYIYDGAAWYTTRGGMRLVWALDAPVDPQGWGEAQARLTAVLQGVGMPLDEATLGGQWNRLMRAPFVVREGKASKPWFDFEPLADEPLDVAKLPAPCPEPSRWANIDKLKVGGLNLSDPELLSIKKATTGRQPTLFKMGAMLRAKGALEDEVRAFLQVANILRCDPPLDESEVDHAVTRACLYEPGTALPDITREVMALVRQSIPIEAPGSDLPEGVEALEDRCYRIDVSPVDEVLLSRLFAYNLKMRASDPPPVYAMGSMMRYLEDRGIWEPLSDPAVSASIQSLSGRIEFIAGHGKDGSPTYKTYGIDASKVANTMKLMQDRCEFQDWEPAPGVAMTKGVLVVENGALVMKPHSPDNRMTFLLPFDVDANTTPTLWLETLGGIFRDDVLADVKIQTLGEFLGCALVGDTGRFAKALLLHGGGSNGKSVITDTIRALFPESVVVSNPPQDMGHEYRKADFAQARVNIVAELPEVAIGAAESFKALVTGDVTSGRYPHGRVFTFRSRCAHIFAANTLPSTQDHTEGFWRRWLVLDLRRRFTEEDRDTTLTVRLRAEHGAIVAWALRCYCDLIARGEFLKINDGVLEAWRMTSNSVAGWLSTLERGPAHTAMEAQAYGAYKSWVEANGFKAFNSKRWSDIMRSLDVEAKPGGWAIRLGGPRERILLQ